MGEGIESKDRQASIRRIVAMSFALACHLVLVMSLLRPEAPDVEVTPAQESDQTALKVRFVPLPRLASTFVRPQSRSVVVRKVPAKESPPRQTKPTARN